MAIAFDAAMPCEAAGSTIQICACSCDVGAASAGIATLDTTRACRSRPCADPSARSAARTRACRRGRGGRPAWCERGNAEGYPSNGIHCVFTRFGHTGIDRHPSGSRGRTDVRDAVPGAFSVALADHNRLSDCRRVRGRVKQTRAAIGVDIVN
jgi:hypothetical protein